MTTQEALELLEHATDWEPALEHYGHPSRDVYVCGVHGAVLVVASNARECDILGEHEGLYYEATLNVPGVPVTILRFEPFAPAPALELTALTRIFAAARR